MTKLAILGYGRAGKDTVGEWLGTHTPLKYVGSTSMVVCPLIAAERGVTPAYAWQHRHRERKFWYDWANEYRKDDPAKLAKKCLEHGDIVTGLRDILELRACKAANLFDLIIWVHRDVPKDPTVTFGPEDCDVILYNTGSLSDLHAKLVRLMLFNHVFVYRDEIYQRPKLPEWATLPPLPIDSSELANWRPAV